MKGNNRKQIVMNQKMTYNQRIDKAQSWLFEKTKTINKPL